MESKPQVAEDIADPLRDLPLDHHERYALIRTLVHAVRIYRGRCI